MNSVYHSTCKFLSLGILLLTFSCNHLFYYPDNHVYFSPERVKVAHKDLLWKSNKGISYQVLELEASTPETATLIHLHGNAENRSSHFLYSSWLTQHGYRVLVPDYQGYGGSEGTPTRRGLVEDVQFFIDKTCASTKNPVFLFGQSLGGAIAIPALAQLSSNCICGLIIESSFSSYRRLARQKLGSLWLTWILQYPLSYLISDNESPAEYVSKIDVPTLVIHGDDDPVVPYMFGKEIFDNLATKDKELWVVPKGSHTPAFQAPDSIYKRKLVEWLAQKKKQCTKTKEFGDET